MSGSKASRAARNRYDVHEVAGAFGDLGTLIPFVVAYVSILTMDPAGVLFGGALLVVGFVYRTPFPVQPMKAIGAAAMTQSVGSIVLTPMMVVGAGMTTALLWFVLGATGMAKRLAECKVAFSTALLNLWSSFIGGIPMCHGAGGMAGNVRFGARTGGATIMLGLLLLAVVLFFADSLSTLFRLFPPSVLGVILFLAGAELALGSRDPAAAKEDRFVVITTAAFGMVNVGVAVVFGVLAHHAAKRGWLKG